MKDGVPEPGDLIWLDFGPTLGREQSGPRPGLVLSSLSFNRMGLLMACPITSKIKGFAFEIPLPEGSEVTGVILSHHVRTLDWNARNVRHVGSVAPETLARVRELVVAIATSEGRKRA